VSLSVTRVLEHSHATQLNSTQRATTDVGD